MSTPSQPNQDPDPFQQGIEELTAQQQQREAASNLAQQHFEGLLTTADELGVPPDGETDHLLGLAAIHLGAISAVESPEAQHAQRRELLMDFTAVGNTAVANVLSKYAKLDPLTEEEVGKVADKIAERAIAQERNQVITEEVYDLLAEIPDLSEPADDEDLAIFLATLTGFCYQLRHNTDEADVELRRRNLIEKAERLIEAGGLNPALRQVAAALLHR